MIIVIFSRNKSRLTSFIHSPESPHSNAVTLSEDIKYDLEASFLMRWRNVPCTNISTQTDKATDNSFNNFTYFCNPTQILHDYTRLDTFSLPGIMFPPSDNLLLSKRSAFWGCTWSFSFITIKTWLNSQLDHTLKTRNLLIYQKQNLFNNLLAETNLN